MFHLHLVRPGFPMGIRSWRMETTEDHSEKSAQEHGKDGGLGWASNQEPGGGILKEGQESSSNTKSLTSGLYSLGSFRSSSNYSVGRKVPQLR